MDASDLGQAGHRRGEGLHGPHQGSAPPQVAGHAAAAAASVFVFVLTLYPLLTGMGQTLNFSSICFDQSFRHHHPEKYNMVW